MLSLGLLAPALIRPVLVSVRTIKTSYITYTVWTRSADRDTTANAYRDLGKVLKA
ncbi:uncharacterized protein RSE6_11770 [Rhynchosporium secalis]|uniref:Uncharacterized protein n=1 Tax=Rhynchosporium secalis TaxID=38038 RepID=A0A1E1MNS1_RHYSE|nr:uncharacterized protein RSE6_11770 [Rhynchosporium secalis]